MKHKIATIGLAFAALASAAFGQLIITNEPTHAIPFSLQGNGATLLTYAETSQPSFTAAGLEFSLISNYNVGDIVVGNGVDGEFFANVTFLARESLRPNHFGVTDATLGGYGTGGTTLYFDYSGSDFGVTKHITAATYTDLNFWHYTDKPGYEGTFFQNEVLSFRTWEAIDVDANRIYTLFGIDDLRSNAIDFDDGIFLVERNLFPVAFESPVPEPSTYGLIGAVALLGLVAYRRFKAGSNVSPFVAQ